MNAFFTSIAHFSINRRKAIIIAFLVLMVVGVGLYLTQQWVFEREGETQYCGEAQDAADLISEKFAGLAPFAQILVLHGDRPVTDTE